MISGVEHIGIAVSNLDEALRIYKTILGLKVGKIRVVEDQKTKVAQLFAGKTKIELLEPTDEESPVAKFLKKRGEGVHHIALEVTNIDDSLRRAKEQGLMLVDEKPRIGVDGFRIAFLHPKSTKNVLIELCEI
jgi:methylmalonyl-CoA/ethylmalonyl-CoA epimerase